LRKVAAVCFKVLAQDLGGRDWTKLRTTQVRIAGSLAKHWTGDIPDTSQKC
jgi:hypothetical protein